jgi:hypothetical protein
VQRGVLDPAEAPDRQLADLHRSASASSAASDRATIVTSGLLRSGKKTVAEREALTAAVILRASYDG